MPDDEKHTYRNWALGIAAVVIGSTILFVLNSPGGPVYEFMSQHKTPHLKIVSVDTPVIDTSWGGAGQVYTTDIIVHNDGDAIASNCRALWKTGQGVTYSKYFPVNIGENVKWSIVSPTFNEYNRYDTSICVECDNNIKSECIQRSVIYAHQKKPAI
ncbi:MAG: hypothetical protein WCJ93_10500 [Methanomicrobiales archaeon]